MGLILVTIFNSWSLELFSRIIINNIEMTISVHSVINISDDFLGVDHWIKGYECF